MRAAPDDLTASARIRAAAMRLFAERGFDATSIRDVAAEAGVSSSLVVHHFKTKAQLKEATDARLISALTSMPADVPTDAGGGFQRDGRIDGRAPPRRAGAHALHASHAHRRR
ncbi:helix-turn-helix domain-containing protein [Cellulomonas sp. P24]|uniref:helix-turn-helix domain-containing protein n=1 Tax=Cellulomonas sp. P24 TaxID=2885206 RepID=UPI00216ACE3D|nr:helix-turn-helix domain-containing protein [Cellulomonas sp. P24]MCR6493521.1 TetR/AcrR family transcriptional regulator [Cellulomonas sp. P24]